MIARALMAFPPFARLVRAMAGVEARELTFEQRIAVRADELRAKQGISALSALAAAEAVELTREHRGIRFERCTFDRDRLLWEAVYETGPARRPTFIRLPLEHATRATQMGIGSTN